MPPYPEALPSRHFSAACTGPKLSHTCLPAKKRSHTDKEPANTSDLQAINLTPPEMFFWNFRNRPEKRACGHNGKRHPCCAWRQAADIFWQVQNSTRRKPDALYVAFHNR